MAGKPKNKVSSKLLVKLRASGENTPLSGLAELLVEDTLHRPLGDLVEAERTARLIHEALSAWQQNDLSDESIRSNWNRVISWLESQQAPLGEVLPSELRKAATELAAQPFSPNRELLLDLLDRPAFRQLIRELLVDILISFGKRLRTPVAESRLGKGLSGLGRRARGRTGSIGSLAGDFVGVVSEGVERQLEGRAAEFADGALSSILQKLADYLCDPSRATEQAALREGLLDGLWDLSGSQIAAELARSNVDGNTEVMRRALGAWLERPEAARNLQDWLEEVLSGGEAHSLHDLLETLGLLQAVREHAVTATQDRLQQIVATDAFGDWLSALAD